MRLKGEDVHDGLREWVKTDLRESPRTGYDLGKFFFSVSAGTIGALATIEKLRTSATFNGVLVISFLVLFVSIIVALLMSLPSKEFVGGETDLQAEYEKRVKAIILRSWIWFGLWLIGALLGVWGIRK